MQGYTILVVDDDEDVLRLLRSILEHEGYRVLTAPDGPRALMHLRREVPHLAILDLQMPGMHGFELSQHLHDYTDVPIIFLTAISDETTKVSGLDWYAEDYITKPFSPRELVARVNRVLRRMGDFSYALTPEIPIDEDLSICFASHTAIVRGREVKLSPKESKLLFILVKNAGRVVSNDFLLSRLWHPANEVDEYTLRVHIHRLRKKLEADPRNPRYILTERGIGYRFWKKS